MPTTSQPRFGRALVLGSFAVLVVLRLLAAELGYFFEQDEMSLANGVASLMSGTVGYLYHYGPQIGYYRLMELLAQLGGGIGAVPLVMSTSAAVAGAVIPAATLVAFRDELSDRVRLLAAAVVACSPVLWMSSQYGNSAVVSTALVVVGLVVLSNRPGTAGLAGALALCAAGVLVRADAVLVAPIVVLLVFRGVGDSKRAVQWLLGGAVAFAALWLTLRFVDPYMGASTSDVAEHFGDTDLRSLFWEHLMWGVSPIVLGFAVLGSRTMGEHNRPLLWTLLLWILPVCAFYFGSTTTPRYFLLAVVPISLCAAAGVDSIGSAARRPALSWSILLGALFVHLFVGLGHFAPSNWKTVLTAPTYDTDDGPMPTGALLYQGYHRGRGVFGASLRAGPWGTRAYVAQGVDPQLARLASLTATAAPRSVLVVFTNWNGHVFHFHALKAGGLVQERLPGREWLAPTRYSLGHTTMTVVGLPSGELEAMAPILLNEGDEVWYVSPREDFPQALVNSKLPEGVEVEGPIDPNAGSVLVYPVRRIEG